MYLTHPLNSLTLPLKPPQFSLHNFIIHIIIIMCRGLQQQKKINGERDRLNIKAFYIRLSHTGSVLPPDYLTLHYLPRINGSPLQIDGSDIRSDSPAFLTLHRVLSTRDVIYGSRERVRTGSGARFEVYLKDEKVIKGIFRKGGGLKEWKMECKCGLERRRRRDVVVETNLAKNSVVAAEVLIEFEGGMKLSEKVDMVAVVRSFISSNFCCLEEIPEEEVENEAEGGAGAGSCCCSECLSAAAEGGDVDGDEDVLVDLELDGVKKKVEVAFWMMCVGVGVGLFVSKASSRSFRKRIFF